MWAYLKRREEAARDAKHAQWGPEHYEGWSRDDLIWRIGFLQGAGRWASIDADLLRRVVLPLVFFAGLVIGLLFGVHQ